MAVALESTNTYQTAHDKTLHATLSLYITAERLESVFGNWTLATRRKLQSRQFAARELSRAIDPLFNDIAIRDRNAAVEEFLIDVDGAQYAERIRITMPERISWDTEGEKVCAEFGAPVARDLDVRTFWYVHSDGALSFHLSFLLHYAHTFEDYYFLSMLQKMMFPKEFSAGGIEVTADICSCSTGVWAIDQPMVKCRSNSDRIDRSTGPDAANGQAGSEGEPVAVDVSFWAFVRDQTGRQLGKLVKDADLTIKSGDKLDDLGLWQALVACDSSNFIEIPGLKLPTARSLFLMQDAALFDLLQTEAREDLKKNPNYVPIVPRGEADDLVTITEASILAHPIDKGHSFDERYYFLSGFFQNIIDFFNQDTSELRDGTHPIYPRTAEQAAEAQFVRYANGRSLFQIVKRSRSLETGNDYIGTCPYAFLVHLMTMHNEFVVRRYEIEIAGLQDKLADPSLTSRGNLHQLLAALSGEHQSGVPVSSREIQRATGAFYQFRLKAFTFFKRHLYDNTLRYESERDLFDSVQRIRGVESRLARSDAIVDGFDRTIKDLEDDKRYRDEREARLAEKKLSDLVAVVGLFSVAQASFQAVDIIRALFARSVDVNGTVVQAKCRSVPVSELLVRCSNLSSVDIFSLLLVAGTAAGAVVVLYYLLGLLFSRKNA